MGESPCRFESYQEYKQQNYGGIGKAVSFKNERNCGFDPTNGTIYAPMAELADALDLGSSTFGCVGSTPTRCTLMEVVRMDEGLVC